MREAMGDLGQAIAVAALEFLGNSQMQCRAGEASMLPYSASRTSACLNTKSPPAASR